MFIEVGEWANDTHPHEGARCTVQSPRKPRQLRPPACSRHYQLSGSSPINPIFAQLGAAEWSGRDFVSNISLGYSGKSSVIFQPGGLSGRPKLILIIGGVSASSEETAACGRRLPNNLLCAH